MRRVVHLSPQQDIIGKMRTIYYTAVLCWIAHFSGEIALRREPWGVDDSRLELTMPIKILRAGEIGWRMPRVLVHCWSHELRQVRTFALHVHDIVDSRQCHVVGHSNEHSSPGSVRILCAFGGIK